MRGGLGGWEMGKNLPSSFCLFFLLFFFSLVVVCVENPTGEERMRRVPKKIEC